jgi:WD40 repeat protein
MEFTGKAEENDPDDMEMEEVHVDLDNAPLDDADIEEEGYDEDEDPSERIDEGDEDEEEEGTMAGGREPSVDMAFVTFQGHSDSVYCSAIHPTIPGIVLTGGGDDRAFIWKYAAGSGEGAIASSTELSGHKDTVTYVGFNFDGSLCFTASYDGTIRVWKFEGVYR